MSVIAEPTLESVEISANLDSVQYGIDSVTSVCYCLVPTYLEKCPELNSIDTAPSFDSVLWELGITSEDRIVNIDSVDLKPTGTNGV